jgi:thioredoxin 1
VHLDDDAVERLIRSSPVPVLVDFYADWCGPCRALAPSLETLAQERSGELMVVKVDTERHQRLAGQLGVRGIPALYLYQGGKVVAQQSGALPLPALRQWVSGSVSLA